MAYQPKSYKKFVATAATATLVASAIAPAASAASFSDVADRYKDAVSYLATEGIAEGYPNGKFGTDDNIKRQDAAVMIARSLGATPDGEYANAGFTDVPADRQWAVNFLVEQKIVEGKAAGQFGANDFTTREEMSKIIANAYKLVGNPDNAFPFTDVSATFKQFVDALYEAGITQGKSETQFGTGLVTRGEFALFIYRAEGSPVQNEEVAVEEISASNNKQIVVELSGNVDLEAAAKEENYTLENAAGDEVGFSVDVPAAEGVTTAAENVKVVITLDEAAENQDVYTLTIDAKVAGEEYTQKVEFFDTTVPVAETASVIGNDTVKVKFSEPIDVDNLTQADLAEAFELEQDGNTLYVRNVEFVKNNTEANVEVYSTFEEGELSVTVNNDLEDYAGLNVNTKEFKLDVVPDEEAPKVVGFKNATQSSVTLVFNEDIELAAGVTAADFYHTNSNNPVDADIDANEPGQQLGAVVDGNELTLHFTANKLPNGTAYIYIDGKSVLDKWDNLNESTIVQEVKVDVDNTKPEVKEVKATGTAATVTFTEKIDKDSIDEDNFQLLDSTGKEVDKIADVKINAKGDGLTVSFTEALTGTYSLVIDGVEDLAGNAMTKVTKSFTVKDTTAIDTDKVTVNGYANANRTLFTLVVKYPEAMATEGTYSVNDLSKYTLITSGDTASVALADLEKASIKVVDNGATVEIRIPKQSADSDYETFDIADYTGGELRIGRVADAAGNYTSAYAFDRPVNLDNTVAIEEVRATSTNTLKVYFEDQINFNVSDLDIVVSGEPTAAPSRVSTELVDGKTVATIQLSKRFNFAAGNVSVTVKADETALKSTNRYGEKLDAGQTTTVLDYVAPSLDTDFDGDFADQVTYNVNPGITTGDTITLDFNEALRVVSPELAATDLVILDGKNKRLVAGTDYNVSVVSNDNLVITFLNAKANAGDFRISTVEKVLYITDTSAQNNKIAKFDFRLEDLGTVAN